MKSIHDHLDIFSNLLDLLENHFGNNCEIVLHDNTKEYEHTIVDIRNGHVTGRKVGDCGGNWGLEVMSNTASDTHIYNKIIHTRNGKIIRGSSMFLKDDAGNNIGSVCINLDITDSLKCEEFLKQFNNYSSPTPSSSELFTTDVNQLMDNLILQCENMYNKPTAQLTKEEKMEVIKFLDSKGAFLITKSGDRVCEFLNISKFTLYNYLETIRQSPNHLT
ncbi:MAG: transcriptional regulator [Clostridia bacterium]|jgi:predicted transcriptional regulator YheO|nr:transcriptional regulator [Clostridia bacterium]